MNGKTLTMSNTTATILSVSTIILLVLAYFIDDYARGVTLTLAGGTFGTLIAGKLSNLNIKRPSYGSLMSALGFFLFTTLFLGFLYWDSAQTKALPFPVKDGTIASFTTGGGGPARNDMGLHFSLFSDSALNMDSKVWYKVFREHGERRENYLRIFYQLISHGDRDPYVGIYTDFSLPPPLTFDVSHYDFLSVNVRLDNNDAAEKLSVGIVLYSASGDNSTMIFPSVEINPILLNDKWQQIRIPLSEFGSPPFVPYEVQLDTRSVYRMGIRLIGTPSESIHGYVDVDNIRFE